MDQGLMMILAVICAAILAAAIVLLYKRKWIDADAIHGAGQILEGLPVTEGNGVFDLIVKYAAVAVHTVEQMVKTGKINRDDDTRKSTAMNIVEAAARVDEVGFGAAEQEIASACIEAEVNRLPRNQGEKKPPDADGDENF